MPPKDKEIVLKETSIKLSDIKTNTTIEDLLSSGAIPAYFDSKEKVMTVVKYGKELGLDEVTSLNSIALIKGKMVINSSILGALLKRKGYDYIWTKDWEVTDEGTDNERITTEVEIFWFSKSLNRELSNKFKMTWRELFIAGLTETNPTYKKYPKAMLRARCITAAVRAIAPDILLGLYTIEEIADVDPNIKLKVNEAGEISAEDVDYKEVN